MMMIIRMMPVAKERAPPPHQDPSDKTTSVSLILNFHKQRAERQSQMNEVRVFPSFFFGVGIYLDSTLYICTEEAK